MALNLNNLKQLLIDNYNTIRENGATEKESADGMANAIVEYSKDAEALIPTPFIIPGVPPVPDASVIGTKVPVVGHKAGKVALSSAIQSSYKAMDPSFSIIAGAIVAYVATLISYSNNTGKNITGTTLIPPPALVSITPIGMAGGSVKDVMSTTASIIHASFMAGTVTGVGINPSAGAIIPAPVVAKLV
jgi:hypothetical protein|tara:strand:+ start:39 stop:605 length:567 start_codon:yes stop_codon:yes gene_type:complete